MAGKRYLAVSLVVFLALLAGLFLTRDSTQAIPFNPVSRMDLSGTGPGANADASPIYSLPVLDGNFASAFP